MVGQVALVAEAALDGDIGEGDLGVAEEMAGPFDPLADEELVWGEAGRLFEAASEMERAESGGPGDVGEGEIFGEMASDELDCPAELVWGEGARGVDRGG